MTDESIEITSEQEKKIDFLENWEFQDYLSFGYLYLLIVGVVSDSIYYGYLGINIVSYSSLLDVLLSPIVRLTDNLVLPAVIFILPAFAYFYIKMIIAFEKKRQAKKKSTDGDKATKIKATQLNLRTAWFLFTCLIIFTTMIGYGLGGGYKQNQYLTSGDINTNTLIEFQDGTTKEVKVFGNNSEYIFYAEEGQKSVSVSSIKENIKLIREISD